MKRISPRGLRSGFRKARGLSGHGRKEQGPSALHGDGGTSCQCPDLCLWRIQVITQEEEREYFKRAARNRNLYDLTLIIRNQGMRPEEVFSLRKEDIDLERRQVHVRWGKTSSARRTLDLTNESRSVLAARCQSASVWVFPSDRKSGAHLTKLNNAHDAACADAKKRTALNFVLYDFRHTFATRMAQAGSVPSEGSSPSHGSLPACPVSN
jgi:integrase